MPVGFKWFVDGLIGGSFGFGGEESAGASFLRRDGSVWTTDKDGIILGLLAAEITARTGRDPGQLFDALTAELGVPFYERIDAPATPQQKNAPEGAVAPSKLGDEANWPASRCGRRSPPRPATVSRSAASRSPPTMAGLPRGLGHRGRLQDLCRKLSQRGPPAADPARSPGRDRAGVRGLRGPGNLAGPAKAYAAVGEGDDAALTMSRWMPPHRMQRMVQYSDPARPAMTRNTRSWPSQSGQWERTEADDLELGFKHGRPPALARG